MSAVEGDVNVHGVPAVPRWRLRCEHCSCWFLGDDAATRICPH
jgi:hypothetical protein